MTILLPAFGIVANFFRYSGYIVGPTGIWWEITTPILSYVNTDSNSELQQFG